MWRAKYEAITNNFFLSLFPLQRGKLDIPEFPEAANKEDSPSKVNVDLWASFQKPVKHPEGIGEAKTG